MQNEFDNQGHLMNSIIFFFFFELHRIQSVKNQKQKKINKIKIKR